MGMPLATYYTYAVHLSIAVSMLTVEVPFGKWSHLVYRPLAVFLHKVKERALQQQLLKEVILENGQQQDN
jgi:quinone-modifying oxidoreductase subunit QmoC